MEIIYGISVISPGIAKVTFISFINLFKHLHLCILNLFIVRRKNIHIKFDILSKIFIDRKEIAYE